MKTLKETCYITLSVKYSLDILKGNLYSRNIAVNFDFLSLVQFWLSLSKKLFMVFLR